MATCESPFCATTPPSPVPSTAHRFDAAGGRAASVMTDAARTPTDAAKMSLPRPSAALTAAKAIGGATQVEFVPSHPHSHQQQQQQRQPCAHGLLDPLFLTEIDQNVPSRNDPRTSLSGDAAGASAKGAARVSPRVEGVRLTRGRPMRRSRSAFDVQHECRLRTPAGNGIGSGKAADGTQGRRQPSSSPSSSRRDTADCVPSVEACASAAAVTAVGKVITTAAAKAAAAEAKRRFPAEKRRSLLPAWVARWTSTSRKEAAPPASSRTATQRVGDVTSPSSFSFLPSPPVGENGDAPEVTYVLGCKSVLLPGESVATASSTNSSTVSVHVCESQEGVVDEVKSTAATSITTVKAAAKLLASLIVRRSPLSATSPSSTFRTTDDATDAERREAMEPHPPTMPPPIIEEVSGRVGKDVTGAYDSDMGDRKTIAVRARGEADRQPRTADEEPTLRTSSTNRHTRHRRWPVRLLAVPLWLCDSSAVCVSISKALCGAVACSWPALLTLCPCASARTEQRSVQAPPTVSASESTGPEKPASRRRRPFAFTSPALYMSPPRSYRAYAPLSLSTKVTTMLCCTERDLAPRPFPDICSSSTFGQHCAVPPSLNIGSTMPPVPLMLHPAPPPPPLGDSTSVGPTCAGHFTRDESPPTDAARESTVPPSRDLWRLARCYAHFERAVEQRGDDGVWPARDFSSPLACKSANLVTAASVAAGDTESRLDDDGDGGVARPLAAFTFDSTPSTTGVHAPPSPRLASTFPFSPVSAVLRSEKEDDVFTTAVMWALEQMSNGP
ncbi:hypothetical protein LSCM1_07855 [Leishmania martiniquensis]|uniref:Uncharacterized protein n=1 Tax=Leishmania martiniquensis TaxID=1580590 RepID=A0A836HHZ0_9TRYP|nr:hypothetical protein LSCM1_07855 [Leishmania martiniquensis]